MWVARNSELWPRHRTPWHVGLAALTRGSDLRWDSEKARRCRPGWVTGRAERRALPSGRSQGLICMWPPPFAGGSAPHPPSTGALPASRVTQAAKPRLALRPDPPHRGLGSPDAPRRPHVRKGSLFPLSTFWSVPSGSRDMAPFAVSGAVFRSQCLKSFEGQGSCLASAHSWGCRPRLRSAQGLPRVPKGSVGHAQGASWASRPSQVQGRTAVPSGTLTPADPAPSRLCRTQEAMSSAQAWGPAAVSASGLLLWTKVHFKQIWSRNL